MIGKPLATAQKLNRGLKSSRALTKRRTKAVQGSPLTPRQEQVLAYVRRCVSKHGAPPTIREIASELECTSNNAWLHVSALVAKGWLAREHGKSRALRILGQPGPLVNVHPISDSEQSYVNKMWAEQNEKKG